MPNLGHRLAFVLVLSNYGKVGEAQYQRHRRRLYILVNPKSDEALNEIKASEPPAQSAPALS
jgi:hypothetical protein